PDQIPCKVFFAFSHRDVTVSTTSWTMGFCRIAFQVFVKNADTWDHRPLHQSGMAEKKPMKVWNAAGMVSVKKTTTPFHNSISFWETACHKLPNHSVIAPQFFTMAMIPAMAAATPAIIPITGSREIFSAPKETARAAITGVSAVNATNNAPSMMTKFCIGSGSIPNTSLTAVIMETRGG